MKRLSIVPLSLLCALAVAGCNQGATPEVTEGQVEQSLEQSPAPEAAPPGAAARGPLAEPGKAWHGGRPHGGPGHGPGGPLHLLHAALQELELTDAQQAAIQGALDDLEPPTHRGPPPADPKASAGQGPRTPPALAKKLAEQVRRGAVDERALAPELASAEQEHAARRAEAAKAVQTLHATLAPAQRHELVTKLSERAERHERGPRGKMGGPGLQGPLGFLLRGLDLTDAQRASIDEALADLKADHPDKAAMKAALQAFEAERFDAATSLPEPPEGRGARMVGVLARVVPLLDAKQRGLLADALEKGPGFDGPGFGRGRKGHHPIDD